MSSFHQGDNNAVIHADAGDQILGENVEEVGTITAVHTYSTTSTSTTAATATASVAETATEITTAITSASVTTKINDCKTYTHSQVTEIFRQAENTAIHTGRVLVIANISKSQNIDQLILLASAHDFTPVIIQSIKTETCFLLRHNIPFFRLNNIDDLQVWLQTHNIPLLGIEIMDSAISINSPNPPFSMRIALMPGNEGTGLSPAQKRACGSYIIIPQYGEATASLNVHVATCVILYRYCSWWDRN